MPKITREKAQSDYHPAKGPYVPRSKVPQALKLFAFACLAHAAPSLAALGASVTLQTGQPTAIRPTEITVLEITLSNNNESATIEGTGFSNLLPGMLPNGLKLASNPSYTCFDPVSGETVPGSGVLTTALGGQNIALSGGVIPRRAGGVDGTCTLRFPVTAGTSDGTGASHTYVIADGSVTGNDGSPVSNSGSVQQSVGVSAITRPNIAKSFSNATAILGGVARTLTITVTNPNPIPLPNFSISDSFPMLGGGGAIIEVADPPNPTSTCTNTGTPATFTPSAAAVTVSASGGTVAANSVCTLTVDVVARHTNGTYSTGSQTNTISASTDFSNDIGIRANANASAAITSRSPLRLSKTFSPTTIAGGQSGSTTITLFNDGSTPLTINQFDDNPIDGVANADGSRGLLVTGHASTCGGTTSTLQNNGNDRGARLTGGIIPAGSSCTFTINFTATTQVDNTPFSYTNNIPPGSVDVGNPAIVSQTASASLLVADTLRVVKAASPINPRPGNPVRFQVDVQNWTAAAMSNMALTDPLENGMTFLSGTIGGIDFNPAVTRLSGASGEQCGTLGVLSATGDSSASFTLTTIPPRASVSTPGACRITFWAMTDPAAPNGASISNTVPQGNVCVGGGVCNGSPSNTTGGNINDDVLTISKSFSPAGSSPEGSITRMTIALGNFSANPITALSISDTLPLAGAGTGQMRVANPANAASSCGGSITAGPGSTSVTLNGGLIPARANGGLGAAGSCSLFIDVVAPAGTYPNVAEANGNQTLANGIQSTVGPVSANASKTFTSILTAQKTFSPSAVASGGRSTVRVTINNSDSVTLPGVQVTDSLPSGMVLAGPTNAYTTCAGPTSISGHAGGDSITVTGASLNGNGSCDLVFDVVATGAGDWINIIPAGGIIAANSGVSNVAQVSATLSNNPGNALTVAKQTAPSTLTFPGQSSLLTLTITNGMTPVTGLSLTDHFTIDGTAGAALNGMRIMPEPMTSTTCPGGLVSAEPDGTQVSVSNVSLAAEAACTVSVRVTSITVGGITNFLPVNAIRTDQALSNNLQASTSLTTQSNIGVTKQFTPAVIGPNERSRLRITFFNAGPQTVTSLSLTDDLPDGLVVPTGPNPVTTCGSATMSVASPAQVRISGGSLAGASGGGVSTCFAEIDVQASAEGSYVNTIPAGALTGSIGGAPVTNTDPAEATLQARLPMVVNKAFDGLTLDAGDPGSFTTGEATRTPGAFAPLVIRLSNPNTIPLTQVALNDTLPEGLFVWSSPSTSTTCENAVLAAMPAGNSLQLTGATIPAGSSCTLTVNVFSNNAGSYQNRIPNGAVSSFEGVRNEAPSAARLVVSSLPEVTKQFEPPVIPPGGTARLSIFVANENSIAMTLTAHLTDTLPVLPGPVTLAAAPNVVSTCTGTIIAEAGSGSVQLQSGATVPPGGCRVEVDITASSAGAHNNNIPVGGLQTSLGSNQVPANAPVLVSTLGYISGKVFLDNKPAPDGIYNAGMSSPLAGQNIELREGVNCEGAILGTVQTDAQGNYLFAELFAGTYSVCQPEQPAGTFNGIPIEGSIVPIAGSTGTAGMASNPGPTSSQITNIILNNNGNADEVSGSPNNNFSEIQPVSISGKAFIDINNDGIQQGTDPAIQGVNIDLSGIDWQGNVVIRSTTTDAFGEYRFTDLPPGTYDLRQPTQPDGTSNGITSAGPGVPSGTAGTPTDVTTLPSGITGIVLPPGSHSVANDFAEIPNGRSVFGMVFRDVLDSGGFDPDAGDTGISDQVIRLTGTDINGNPVNLTTTTQSDGTFSFIGIPESNAEGYTLTQDNQPAGTINGQTVAGTTGGTATPRETAPSAITGLLLNGENTVSANNLFGEIPVAPPAPPPRPPQPIPVLGPVGMLLLVLTIGLLVARSERRRG